MAAKTWSVKKQNQLVKMYESGKYSTLEIADKLGVSQPTVYNHLRRQGWATNCLPRRYRGPAKVEFTQREKERILAWKQ